MIEVYWDHSWDLLYPSYVMKWCWEYNPTVLWLPSHQSVLPKDHSWSETRAVNSSTWPKIWLLRSYMIRYRATVSPSWPKVSQYKTEGSGLYGDDVSFNFRLKIIRCVSDLLNFLNSRNSFAFATTKF